MCTGVAQGHFCLILIAGDLYAMAALPYFGSASPLINYALSSFCTSESVCCLVFQNNFKLICCCVSII